MRCIVAGMIDNIWKYESSYKHKTYYTNNKDNTLQIDKKSVVRSNIIVAEKKSIPTQDNDIIEFITNASVASSELIAQVAPHLITTTK